MSDRQYDNDEELIAVRTQLTVAMLSLELLQRRHDMPADAKRLCSYTAEALSRIKDELARLDTVLAKRKDRMATRSGSMRQYGHDARDVGDNRRD